MRGKRLNHENYFLQTHIVEVLCTYWCEWEKCPSLCGQQCIVFFYYLPSFIADVNLYLEKVFCQASDEVKQEHMSSRCLTVYNLNGAFEVNATVQRASTV